MKINTDPERRFRIVDMNTGKEAFRMSELDIRVWLAMHEKEYLIKELFDSYKPIVED